MSVTTSNFQHPTLKWREKGDPSNLIMATNGSSSNESAEVVSSNVDDGLTSLSWLQNLNMCMTRLGAPTPPTPPASPLCFGLQAQQLQQHNQAQTLGNHQPPKQPRRTSSNSALSKGGVVQMSVEGTCSGSQCALLVGPQCEVAAVAAATAASITAQSSGKPKVETSGKKRSSSSQGNRQSASSRSKKAAIAVTGSLVPAPVSTTTTTASTKAETVSSTLLALTVTPQEETSGKQQQEACQTASVVEEEVDYKVDGTIKPPYSYATLICMAMKANRNKMTLSSIYKWIKENFLYYRNADPSWQV